MALASNLPTTTDPSVNAAPRFFAWMTLPIGLAILLQSLYIADVHRTIYHNGDAVYYDLQAKLITQGYGFVNPYALAWKSILEPSANHPPLTTLFLVAADELGASTWTWHIVAMAAVFVVAVGISGIVGRQLAGPRAGVVVAIVVATYPYLWVNPGAVLAETLELLLVALGLWAAIRFSKRPRFRSAAELGLYLGLLALTRSELILLIPLIGLPVVLVCRGLTSMGRLKNLAVMSLIIVVVIGPWIGRNMTTFHHREYLSTEGGVTLATANCDPTYYGRDIGGWSFSCDTPNVAADADESDIDRVERRVGERYIETHKSRFMEVVAVRVLRVWDLYHPIQQAQLDQSDARPAWVSESGMVYFYLLAPFALAGVVALRRRRMQLFPLLALIAAPTLAAALFYANGRYRVEGDLGVAILGGVGIDMLIGRYLNGPRFRTSSTPKVRYWPTGRQSVVSHTLGRLSTPRRRVSGVPEASERRH